MREKTDLGVVLLTASALLFSLNFLTQCSSAAHRNETAAVPSTAARDVEKADRDSEKERRKSVGEAAAEEDDEERARVQNVGHALQTIGADPEARKTYGFPP